MTRRETLVKLSGLAGAPVFLAGCSMETIRRIEADMGDSMRYPGTGIQGSKIPKMIKVMVLARYPATPHQAQVVETRARQAVASIARRERRKAARVEGGAGKQATIVVGGQTMSASAGDAQVAAAALRASVGTALLAIDAPADTRLQGSNAVMLWNIPVQRLAGNDVYDIASPPPKGQVAQWDLTPASYAGRGN